MHKCEIEAPCHAQGQVIKDTVWTYGTAHCGILGNFGSEIQIGNQQVWGKNWVLKVVINKFSVMNLAKKGPKIQVSSMMDRKGDKILSTTSRFFPFSGPRSSPFLSIIPKIGKPRNLFSPISPVDSDFKFYSFFTCWFPFYSFSLVGYHFFSKMS